jgi:hypothetical protein
VWDVLESWWPKPVCRGRAIRRDDGVYRLVKHYLSVVAYASRSQVERVIGVPPIEVEAAATRLHEEGLIDLGVPIDGLPGRWLVWRT